MKLKLHELKEALSLSFSEGEGWLRDVLTRLRLKYDGPLSLHLKLYKQKEDLYIEGHFVATLLLSCSRCANDMSYKIDEFFSPVFVYGKEPDFHDSAIDRGELDVTYFQSDEIDLSEILNEQIVLLLPIQSLCRQDCKGLCVQCGQDLNVGGCGCERQATRSVFGSLKKLKIQRKKGG